MPNSCPEILGSFEETALSTGAGGGGGGAMQVFANIGGSGANFIRNTANYSPPTSDLAADANTTVLWSMHKMNIGHDSSGNGFDGTTPATLTTFDSAVAGEW